MKSDLLTAVRSLISEGHSVVPLSSGRKCTEPDWPTRTFTIDDFSNAEGVGVKPENDLEIIDVDCAKLAPFAESLLPITERIDGRPGKSPGHFLYFAPGLKRTRFKNIDNTVIVEILSTQAALPPSISDAGPRFWVKNGPIARVDPVGLYGCVRALAVAGILGLHWPAGSRHECAMVAAGLLLHLKVDARTVQEIISVAARMAGDDEVADRVRAAKDTAAAHASGTNTTGGPTLEQLVGKAVVARIREWFQAAKVDDRTFEEKVEIELERRLVKRTADQKENPPKPIPEILTLKERLALPRSKTVWRIHELQQAGHRVLFAAPAKAGKTSLVVNASRCLVDEGAKFLDAYDVERVDLVTVLDFEMAEDDPGQLDDWYRDTRIQHPERIKIVPLRGRASAFNIIDPTIRAEWAERLRGTNYLIWDCVSTVIQALGLDENTDAQRLLTSFDELLQEAGIHDALVVQHMGHSNERARGSSGFLAWPDVLWTMVVDDKDENEARYFKANGRGVHVPEQQLVFNQDLKRFGVADDGMSRKASVEDRVLKLVSKEPGIRKTTLPSRIGGDDHKVKAAIKELLEIGSLREETSGQVKTLFVAEPRAKAGGEPLPY